MADSETLRRLVIECLERLEAEGPVVVDALCAAHPDEAAALRRRLAILGGAGLIGGRAPTSQVPERLGDFRLLARLGGGGMGVVYEAEQTSLGRTVALKLVRPEHLYFPNARERFQREIEAIARLQHPGVVPVHAVGEEQGIPYIAMERVRGLTLAEVLQALAGRQPQRLAGIDLQTVLAERVGGEVAAFPGSWEQTILALVRQAAEALEHCHRRGVLHRDVKPSNLMLTVDGRVQLLDFGIAATGGGQRLTLSGAHLGSPLYMSPEQLRGEYATLDVRADVYALGVTLYELLTLSLPYHGASTEETRRAALQGTPAAPRVRNPALSRDAEAVCLKAMDVDRARRYPSAGDLARDLADVLAHRPVTARPPSAALRAWRWTQRHPTASVALAVFVVVPLALAWQQRRARLHVDAERATAQASLAAALQAVDHMLLRVGDETLADVPQLEVVRGELLDDALALLDRLLATHAGDASVLRLAARARHRAGALEALLGRTADAEASFRKSEELLGAFPDATLEVASVQLDRGELLLPDPARAADARAALDAAAAALTLLPEDAVTLLSSSRAQTNLGFLEEQLGHLDAARTADLAGVATARAAVEASGGVGEARLQLAAALNQLGKLRRIAGEADAALAPLEESVALLAALVDERPAVAEWRLRLGLGRSTLGYIQFGAGRHAAAREQALAARDEFAKLAADFPRVPRYRLELAGMLQALGVLETDPTQVVTYTQQALALLEGVAAESPAQIDLLANIAAGHANLALSLAGQGQSADALVALEKSAGVRRTLAAANPGDPLAGSLLDHQLRTMDLLLGGEPDAATRALARSLAQEAQAEGRRDAAAFAADARWAGLLDPAVR